MLQDACFYFHVSKMTTYITLFFYTVVCTVYGKAGKNKYLSLNKYKDGNINYKSNEKY